MELDVLAEQSLSLMFAAIGLTVTVGLLCAVVVIVVGTCRTIKGKP